MKLHVGIFTKPLSFLPTYCMLHTASPTYFTNIIATKICPRFVFHSWAFQWKFRILNRLFFIGDLYLTEPLAFNDRFSLMNFFRGKVLLIDLNAYRHWSEWNIVWNDFYAFFAYYSCSHSCWTVIKTEFLVKTGF